MLWRVPRAHAQATVSGCSPPFRGGLRACPTIRLLQRNDAMLSMWVQRPQQFDVHQNFGFHQHPSGLSTAHLRPQWAVGRNGAQFRFQNAVQIMLPMRREHNVCGLSCHGSLGMRTARLQSSVDENQFLWRVLLPMWVLNVGLSSVVKWALVLQQMYLPAPSR